MKPNGWPPKDGKRFIREEHFGQLLLDIVDRLSHQYPLMDFTDAVAHVFSWFDRKLVAEPTFINVGRFPSLSAFKAYLRQAVWNAGRLAERQRDRRERVGPLPVDKAIVTSDSRPEDMAALREAVDALDEPHRTVFSEFFFHERELADIANIYGGRFNVDELTAIYKEAIDLLAKRMGGVSAA